MPVIRTRDQQPFNPGQGLPVITPQGVDLTNDQLFKVQSLAARAGVPLRTGYAPAVEDPYANLKRVTMSLGAPRVSIGAAALVNWAERHPLLLPVKTKRWRLRVGNVRLDTLVRQTQQFTVSDIVQGILTGLTAQGRIAPSYGVAPVKVADGGLTPNDGTDWVSAWVTDPAQQFGPEAIKTLGLALSGTSNGNGMAFTSVHGAFRNNAAGAAATLNALAATGYRGDTLALDKRLEYEFEGDNPIGLWVGASGDEGYNITPGLDGGGNFEPVFPHESPPGVYGMRLRIPWVNASITGATQTPFLAANSLAWSRFDLAHTIPDFAVVNLGGNSVSAGVALGTIQGEILTVINNIRNIGVKRVYLCTIGPSAYATPADDAKELVRTNFNAWARNKPLGIYGVIDVDAMLRDPNNLRNHLADFRSTDNIHPNLGGYNRWGNLIPEIR